MFREAVLVTLLVCGTNTLPASGADTSTYTGRLTPMQVADPDAAPKGFQIQWFRSNPADPNGEAMFVIQEDLHALPWFLRAGFAPQEGPAGPVVGYRLEGRSQLVRLPPLLIRNLPAESPDGIPLEISTEIINGRECRLFEGPLPSGRHARVALDAKSGQLVQYTGIVVVGRGDRFELTMELDETKTLSTKDSIAITALANRIKSILPDVSDTADPVSAIVPQATLDGISKERDQWLATAKDTSYQSYVNDLLRDVETRQKSHQRVREAAKNLIGSPAPQLPTIRLDGTPLDASVFKGKTIVLHFWTYDMEPLIAPFGQVGSLDFLARKHAQSNVAVVGVAVDPNFDKPGSSEAAMRSSRRFVEFMNLDYTMCRDNGTLLRKLGDPLSLDAELPLWVVINPEGNIEFYKTGLFEEKPGEGLKELEAAITAERVTSDQATE